MREICIILQAPTTRKLKYAQELLRQMHIFDTTAANPILQKAYLANALVNPQGLGHTFYEMDQFFEHQNREFKQFYIDRDSSLQESNDMFRLYILSVDFLHKVRSSLNKVIVGQEKSGYHPTKNPSFDIFILADQLHQSKSTDLCGLKQEKIYFSKNQVPNIIKQGMKYLHQAIEVYKDSIQKNPILLNLAAFEKNLEPLEIESQNKAINKLFI